MANSTEVILYREPGQDELRAKAELITARHAPEIVRLAGKNAEVAWEEFFQAGIANAHTRKNYLHAVRQFLAYAERRNWRLDQIIKFPPATSANTSRSCRSPSPPRSSTWPR
jgi:hypothetical protein